MQETLEKRINSDTGFETLRSLAKNSFNKNNFGFSFPTFTLCPTFNATLTTNIKHNLKINDLMHELLTMLSNKHSNTNTIHIKTICQEKRFKLIKLIINSDNYCHFYL